MNLRRTPIHRLLPLAVALSLAGVLLWASTSPCAADASHPSTLGTAIGPAHADCANASEDWPTGLFPALTEKRFWIILGLVVLGWLVLAADFPENDTRRTGEGEP